ncbi:MAG: prepilin-type N-terminal cleavage/methylation domain-containing protein [bacterium]|nr:prepilin-type N-terminal cleavage/methylation domain-containing protein [bacterium]MDD5354442.1 prepilin-type N-terminal cleavage/methylation domain-containing protein [bacterium]MDD5756092.1 prepilin-type N-terminal cleavage/methylation domain-containing protein [bacterium]
MSRNKGVGLVEMLVAVIIIMLMVYVYMKVVLKDTVQKNGETAVSQGVVQRAQEKVDNLNKKINASERQYDNTNQ